MADAAYQTRKDYDWCYPDWPYPWCDPWLDTDAVDIKKLREALQKVSGDLDGDKAKEVIDQVVHAIQFARWAEGTRRKPWPGGRYRHRD